jgi:hypothetical protein
MNKARLPLALELTKPVVLAGDGLELSSGFDPRTQLSSRTNTKQNTQSFNALGVLSDISVDVAVDDVIA